MSHRAAKRLRAKLSSVELPESGYLIHSRTNVIRRGWGKRAAYQRMKGKDAQTQAILIAALKTVEVEK